MAPIGVVMALAKGATLVPHAAGGVIAVAKTGGYIAGTYLSPTVIALIKSGSIAAAGGTILTSVYRMWK